MSSTGGDGGLLRCRDPKNFLACRQRAEDRTAPAWSELDARVASLRGEGTQRLHFRSTGARTARERGKTKETRVPLAVLVIQLCTTTTGTCTRFSRRSSSPCQSPSVRRCGDGGRDCPRADFFVVGAETFPSKQLKRDFRRGKGGSYALVSEHKRPDRNRTEEKSSKPESDINP